MLDLFSGTNAWLLGLMLGGLMLLNSCRIPALTINISVFYQGSEDWEKNHYTPEG